LVKVFFGLLAELASFIKTTFVLIHPGMAMWAQVKTAMPRRVGLSTTFANCSYCQNYGFRELLIAAAFNVIGCFNFTRTTRTDLVRRVHGGK
jgi:hypothetical protein